MDNLKDKINVAMSQAKATLVLKNASIINVFTQCIEKANIAICDGTIVGIGDYVGEDEIDCEGLYVAPGFIDAHVHIESSMVTPEIFSHLAIKHGVTTVIADPHEIANIIGTNGIELMIKSSKKGVIDSYFMLPSCVPAIDFEDNGALLESSHLSRYFKINEILGLGEVMDVNAVVHGKDNMLKKIILSSKHQKCIDGHCPKIGNDELNAYLCAGITTDHECTEPTEASLKVSRGMYVMLREGSAAKDLIQLLPAVNQENYHRFLFCTDDRHIEDLIELGSIDHCIRIAIKNGLDPIKAYTIATLNAANCYHLRDRGAIAPGKIADLVIFDNLEQLNIQSVIKKGVIYDHKETSSQLKTKSTVHLNYVKENHFQVEEKGSFINVIKAHPGSLKTSKVIRKVKTENHLVNEVISEEGLINKIAVFERHKNTSKHFTGFIEGVGLKGAAIAQTISHDSHNVVVIGDSDLDMMVAVNELIKMNGGIVIVKDGKLVDCIQLPIGGIMTNEHPQFVYEKVKQLNSLAKQLGVASGIDPFITLSFMALPVIPDLKITPRGLFDYHQFKFIDLFIK